VNHPGSEQYPQDGAALATAFRAGYVPPAVQVPFAMTPSEVCVGAVDVRVEQWLPGDDTYTHKSVAWAGGIGGLVLGGTLNAIGNARRRSKAGRNAAEQWRYIDNMRVYCTTARIALQSNREWHDLWYVNMRTLEHDAAGIIIQMSGNPPSRFHMKPPDYWYVMVRRFAWNQI
jgi:hypothetical protein